LRNLLGERGEEMSMKMSIDAYKELIEGNILWLREQPDSCECSHIMGIVRDSTNYYYPENYKKELEQQQAAIDKLKTAFKFAYENGTFYPAAFNVLDPVYDEFIKDD
jgi:hypothetical protein